MKNEILSNILRFNVPKNNNNKKTGKTFEGAMEEREEKGNRSKKEGNYPYFVYLFNISLYDREKVPKKQGRISTKFKERGKLFLGVHNIYTPEFTSNGRSSMRATLRM